MGVGGDAHVLAQSAAELDPASGLVAEHVLDQEGHAAKRPVAERLLVQGLDPVRVGFDDGVDRGIDGAHGGAAVSASSLGETCLLATSPARPSAS
jgi:hypothetical protein